MADLSKRFYGTPLWITNSDQAAPYPWITLVQAEPQTIAASLGGVHIDGLGPTILSTTELSAAPLLGAVHIDGLAPAIAPTMEVARTPDTGGVRIHPPLTPWVDFDPHRYALRLQNAAPTLIQQMELALGVAAPQAIGITGQVPSEAREKGAAALLGAVSVGGLAPLLGREKIALAGLGAIQAIGYGPDEQLTLPSLGSAATPDPAALAVAGLAPALGREVSVLAGAGAVGVAGLTPTLMVREAQIAPAVGSLTVTGVTPALALTSPPIEATVTVGLGSLQVAGLKAALGTGQALRGRRRRIKIYPPEQPELALTAANVPEPFVMPLGKLPRPPPVAPIAVAAVSAPDPMIAARAARAKRRKRDNEAIAALLAA
jgi:hypothetical protein